MKKVVLIGDSIRLGYQNYVKSALDGVAEVYYPEENCRFAQFVLRFAHEWKRLGKWPDDIDVVHWNAGSWDVLRIYDDGPLTPPEFYGDLIKRVDKRLRKIFPNAKMVFATTCSIVEEGYRGEKYHRYNKEIEEFNKIALDALKDTDTEINDLYTLTTTLPKEYRSDEAHWNTPDGVKMLGGQVLSYVCKAIDVKPEELSQPDCIPANISAKILGV